MEGYKKTTLGWLPEDWKVVKLGDVTKCFVGIASSATYAYSKNGIALIRNQNIKEGKIDRTDLLFISETLDKEFTSRRLKEGDIVTVRIGYPGISAVITKEFEGQHTFTTLISRPDQDSIAPVFLNFCINASIGVKYFESAKIGGGQKNIGVKIIRNFSLPLPPKAEQVRIAAVLSTVDATREALEARIEATESLKKGLMQRLFREGIGHSEFKDSKLGRIPGTWEVVKLGEILNLVQYGLSIPKAEGGTLPIFKMNNFKNGKMNRHGVDKVNLEKGDILFNRTNSIELVGKTGIFDLEGDYTFASYLLRFRTNSSCSPEFLNYFLNWGETQHKLKNIAALGVSQANINPSQLQKVLEIPLPPKAEQEKIAAILSTVDERLENLRAQVEGVQTLKKGLMQQLLTGRMRLR